MRIPRVFLHQRDAGWPIEIYEQRVGLVWSELRRTPGEERREKLAGAEGFEPSPSSLTVRCPTSWTTPQRAIAREENAARKAVTFAEKRARSISLRYHEERKGQTKREEKYSDNSNKSC